MVKSGDLPTCERRDRPRDSCPAALIGTTPGAMFIWDALPLDDEMFGTGMSS